MGYGLGSRASQLQDKVACEGQERICMHTSKKGTIETLYTTFLRKGPFHTPSFYVRIWVCKPSYRIIDSKREQPSTLSIPDINRALIWLIAVKRARERGGQEKKSLMLSQRRKGKPGLEHADLDWKDFTPCRNEVAMASLLKPSTNSGNGKCREQKLVISL